MQKTKLVLFSFEIKSTTSYQTFMRRLKPTYFIHFIVLNLILTRLATAVPQLQPVLLVLLLLSFEVHVEFSY